MRTLFLSILLGVISFSQAQDIKITSTRLLDGKSKFCFKERYTEWFTSNTIRYQFDSNLNQYVSTHVTVNETKAVFLPDTIRVKKRIRIKKQLTVLTDSVAQAFIFLIQDTTKNSDGTSLSMRTSHRYEHIYIIPI